MSHSNFFKPETATINQPEVLVSLSQKISQLEQLQAKYDQAMQLIEKFKKNKVSELKYKVYEVNLKHSKQKMDGIDSEIRSLVNPLQPS